MSTAVDMLGSEPWRQKIRAGNEIGKEDIQSPSSRPSDIRRGEEGLPVPALGAGFQASIMRFPLPNLYAQVMELSRPVGQNLNICPMPTSVGHERTTSPCCCQAEG